MFALLLCEFALMKIRPVRSASLASSDQYTMYRFDATLGWRPLPNHRSFLKRDEFTTEIQSNSFGWRDREHSHTRTPGVKRIAVIGDSFTWGLGVASEDRFTEQLDRLNGPSAEILNFGVSGYGPVQHLLILDEILAFNPDEVIIQFCLSNDYADNTQSKRYGYFKPYGILDPKGQLSIISSAVRPTAQYHTDFPSLSALFSALARYSRIADIIYLGLQTPKDRDLVEGHGGLVALGQDQDAIYDPRSKGDLEASEYASLVNRAVFSQIAHKLREKNIPLLVVAGPTKCEVGDCPVGTKGVRQKAARNLLSGEMASLNIEFFDPSDNFLVSDYWTIDGHWQAAGHKKFAAILFSYRSKDSGR